MFTKALPLDTNHATIFCAQGNTTNDSIQSKHGAFAVSFVLEQLNDSLILETATDGDIQVVKATANGVRTRKHQAIVTYVW
jgi:hypothetical protein